MKLNRVALNEKSSIKWPLPKALKLIQKGKVLALLGKISADSTKWTSLESELQIENLCQDQSLLLWQISTLTWE